MNDKGSSSPSNYSNNSSDNMHTDNQDDVATAVVDEAGVTIITQDENNTHDEATAVDDEAEERIITQDKSPKRSITFDDQTAMVSKRKKDNEKKILSLASLRRKWSLKIISRHASNRLKKNMAPCHYGKGKKPCF